MMVDFGEDKGVRMSINEQIEKYMIRIKLTEEEIEKIFEIYVKEMNTTKEKPVDMTWRFFYGSLLAEDLIEGTNNIPNDWNYDKKILKRIFNIPLKLKYFFTNFYDPDGEHYLLIKDYFNSQPEFYSDEEIQENPVIGEQYKLFYEWKDKVEKEGIKYIIE